MTASSLPHLATFVSAAESCSFTATARAMGVSQAAISQRIQQLEGVLRVSLFRREGGRLSLTEAGRTLCTYAREILRLHDEVSGKLRGSVEPECVSGELELAASSVPGEHLLPRALTEFRQRYPKIKVRLSVSDTVCVVQSVAERKVPIGFVGAKLERACLTYQPFAKDRIVVAVPADHPWGRRRSVPLQSLMKATFIQREKGSATRQTFETCLREAGQSPSDLRVTLELGSNEAIKEAILRGAGVAMVSEGVIEKEIRDGSLHSLTVKGLSLQREFYVVRNKDLEVSRNVALFVEHVTRFSRPS